jgi:hypothetical protein
VRYFVRIFEVNCLLLYSFIRSVTLAKIILILLAFVVIVILAFSFVLGALRRLIFGKIMTPPRQQTQEPAAEVLYEKDGVTALRGEWKPKQSER